ncbi:MAG TPA: caspase family protein, partial [Longimicrobium sp.]
MARGIAIHIGVNDPASNRHARLSLSEGFAWKMAELSHQAGYGAIHMLCGAEATREAVHALLSAAATALRPRDTLFVSFSGHGSQVPDANGDERDGLDETWCLYDGYLVDDDLMDIWRKAAAETRVLVVSESCFAGGMRYADDLLAEHPPRVRPPVYRSGGLVRGVKQYVHEGPSSCVSRETLDEEGIQASVLLMAGAGEKET